MRPVKEREHIQMTCDCVGRCTILHVESWLDGETPQTWSWDFYTTADEGSFAHRLRVAWNLLRGKPACFQGVVLAYEDMQELRTFLEKTLPAKPKSAVTTEGTKRITWKEGAA